MTTTHLSDLLDRLRLIVRVGTLARRNRWTPSTLAAHRARRLASLRRHARRHSAFYREFHRGLDDAPLDALPVLTKERLMASFDDAVTVPGLRRADLEAFATRMSVTELFADRFHVIATSGTTGSRGIFPYSIDEWRMIAMAGVARAMAWSGGGRRMARPGVVTTSTIPWHMTARAAAELARLGLARGRVNVDAGMPVAELVAILNTCQPDDLMIYPSVLQLLARERIAGRLAISPSRIRCTSEVLTASAREEIIDAFGVSPGNFYAASEVGCIGASCAAGEGLHLSEDLLIVENVDAEYRPVAPGVLGEKVLVTALEYRTLPLIRYEIADRIALDPAPCPCGLPFARIADVTGRQGDVLHLPGRDGTTASIAPAQITARLRGTPVRQWQVTLSAEAFDVACVCDAADFDARDIAERLAALLAEAGAAPMVIRPKPVERLERGPTGKASVVTVVTR